MKTVYDYTQIRVPAHIDLSFIYGSQNICEALIFRSECATMARLLDQVKMMLLLVVLFAFFTNGICPQMAGQLHDPGESGLAIYARLVLPAANG